MRDAGSVVRTYTIAVLPGDGIGPEVIAQAERALEAAGERFGIEFTLRRFPLGAAGGGAPGGAFPEENPAAGGGGAAPFVVGVGGPPPPPPAPPLRPEVRPLPLPTAAARGGAPPPR